MATTPPSAAVPPDPAAAPTRPAWQRNLPNALTLARLAMTISFVAILSIYRFPDTNTWALPTALILFIVAALTDALDGYLARRWNVVSVFGRIMDPFADKILILGAFVMLAGPQFWVDPRSVDYRDDWAGQASGVLPWMAVVIISRELLVTTIRAVLEGRGIDFSAAWSGKAKMIVQAVSVPVIMLLLMLEVRWLASNGWLEGHTWDGEHFRLYQAESPRYLLSITVCAWAVTLITALSAIPYITRAITALRKPA